MKTNITVASNIFHRSNNDISYDPDFVAQVIGHSALQKIKEQYGGSLDRVQLSAWQEEMLREDKRCSYAKNGEMTHGLVRKNGEIVWQGRCEYSECADFSTCLATQASYQRLARPVYKSPERDAEPLAYEWLGNIEGLFQDEFIIEQPPEDITPPEVVIADIKSFVVREEFIPIENPVKMIEAGITDKVLVNAAPGSGKTYTVIHRLEYIIKNNLVDDFSSILVLVYTNAAKNEILARIEAGILHNTLPPMAKNLDICTFDSLATSYLAAVDAQFTHLDYNGRVKLFNEQFLEENFSNFAYVIVDELQDLVNERAKMILNILSAIKCGYLLLGDKCQSIYDYDCYDANNLSSVDFYKRLEMLLPNDVVKYELLGNQRQNTKLAALSNNIRSALLDYDPPDANQFIASKLSQIIVSDTVEHYDFRNLTKRTAILCRNNGEAEYVSHLLHTKGIKHTLLRSTGQTITINRFVADCLWDYHGNQILSRSVFTDRYCARVLDDAKNASDAFDSLSEVVYDEIKDFVEIDKLAQSLSYPMAKTIAKLLNETSAQLTVSTIHKAKGREFDTVFLLDSGFKPTKENTEEARVWYVGCTRAKSELFKLKKSNLHFKRAETYTSRWVQLKRHKVKWTRQLKSHCCNVVLGLPMDFSEAGFAEGNFAKALKTQEYIAKEINVGDCVAVELVNQKYQVKHQGNTIGFLSDDMPNQLLSIVRESNPVSNAPPHLSSVYVANIITVTPSRFPDEVPPYFRESKFWLGVELTGFPKIDWHYHQAESGDVR